MLRTDAHTLEIVIPKGQGFFPAGHDDVVRSDDAPLHAGDHVDVPGMHVTVLDPGDDGPARIRFVFDRDLDDPALTWITQGTPLFRDTAPPRIGFGEALDQ